MSTQKLHSWSITASLIRRRVLLTSSFALIVQLSFGQICDTVTNANGTYRLCFNGVTYNGSANTSTWSYTLTRLSGNNISHVVFSAPCAMNASHVVSTTGGCTVVYGSDPPTGVNGIKYENCASESTGTITVSYTLNGMYGVGSITFGLKAGTGGYVYSISGPDCQSITGKSVSLNLTAECRVGNTLYWRVTGDDDVDNVYFTWTGPSSSSGAGVVKANQRYYFTTPTSSSPTAIIQWYNPATNSLSTNTKAHNTWPCVYHILPEKSWAGTLPSNLSNTNILVAESSIAKATCGYDAGGMWKCTYTRKAGNPITSPNPPVDLEVPFGESYNVYEIPFSGWIASAGVGGTFQRVLGFDGSTLPNALTYQLAPVTYSANIPNQLPKFGTHTVVNQPAMGDCYDALDWLKSYSVIAFGNLTTMKDAEYNIFVGGNFNITAAVGVGTQLNTSNFGTNYTRKSWEVAGSVIGGGDVSLWYSGAFGPSNTVVQNNPTQWTVNGRKVNLNTGNQGSNLMIDYGLALKAVQMEADLKAASFSLSLAAANNTFTGTNNLVFDATTQSNGIAVFNLTPAQVNTLTNASSIEVKSNSSVTTIIINVPGTNINFSSGTNFSGQTDQNLAKIIWNFYEATSISIPNGVKGSVLAPMANVSIGNNADGVVVGKNISISSESHKPYFAGDFTPLCTAPCTIKAQFTQACVGSNPSKIVVLGYDAPSGQYLVKQGTTTVAGPAVNGAIVSFNGAVNTTYTVVDKDFPTCFITFTTVNTITGCNEEEVCPNAIFFDMTTNNGFRKAGLLGQTGNFNAIVGGNFTTNGTGDTEGRLAVGGNFSNTGTGLYTVGAGNPAATGGLNAAMGEDNLVVVGDIDGPVGVRGNAVHGGTTTGVSFIAGTGGVGIQRYVNDVTNNVLNISAAIAHFQSKSSTLSTCTQGTSGTVTSSFGTVTLDGLNATGLVKFTLPNAAAGMTYNFINVGNATAILVNVGGTTATFSSGSIQLNGNIIPTYPVNNSPAGELAFVKKTLWNFPNVTTFNLTSYALMGSILAPQANATLNGGGMNGQVVFGGNVTTSGGFEFHNFCYEVDIETACAPTCDLQLTSLSISNCMSGNYTFSFGASWVGAPTTGNFQVFINDSTTPQNVTRTNFNVSGMQTLNVTVPCTMSVYKVRVRFADNTGCSYTAVFPSNPIDPLGYIYCSSTGELVTGGTITVTPPPGGAAVIFANGSNGKYDFFTNGVVGVYEITYTPPTGYTFDSSRPAGVRAGDTDDILDPTPGSEDNPLPGANPVILGSGDNNNDNFLDNFTQSANPYFFKILIVNGTPAVLNNNFPMNCPVNECTDFPNFGSIATKKEASNVTSTTVNKPSGTAEGDLLLAVIATDGLRTVTAPSGWTLINQGNTGGNNNTGATLAVFRKFAGAAEPANYTFTVSASEEIVGTILRYTSVDPTTPIDVVSTPSTGNNNAPVAPPVTTTVPNTTVLRIFAADSDQASGTITTPSGHTARIASESSTNSGGVILGVAERNQAAAGSTGTATFGLSASERWRSLTLAIRSASPRFDTPVVTSGSCTQGVPNSDNSIKLSNMVNSVKAGISTAGAGSYNGPGFATATAISGGMITFSNLQQNTTYIIRVFRTVDCYKDVTVTMPAVNCTPAICVTNAQTFLLDFDTDQNGNPLVAGTSNINTTPPYNNIFGGGMGVTFTTTNPTNKPLNLYNSEGTGGLDPDLERNSTGSGAWAFGNIPRENLKNLLIVNETSNIAIPNDDAAGGQIVSISTMFLQEISFDIVDLDNATSNDFVKFENTATGENKTVLFMEFRDIVSNTSIFKVPGVTYGDRSANRITGITAAKLGMSAFNKITFNTDDSFGIGTICMKKARTDFGDLSNTYPVATAILGPDANNDGKPDSRADGMGSAVWAGNTVDSEATQQFSANADGDDLNNLDDEDGLAFPPSLTVGQPANFTITLNASQNGTMMYYGLWFDWNNDGVFDDFYNNTIAITYTGSPVAALVTVTPPSNASSDYKLRLIVSDVPITSSMAGGTFTNGEVEDYAKPVALPIELLEFTARWDGRHSVLLNWRTASEKNNDYMEVQRSWDAKNFEPIGRVKGYGDSAMPRSYSFKDDDPFPGINYYRLKQVDFDGVAEYHKIVSVLVKEVKANNLLLFPTVVAHELNIALSEETEEAGMLVVTDMTGRTVLRASLPVGARQYTLNVATLPAGHYTLAVQSGRIIRIGRFVKE